MTDAECREEVKELIAFYEARGTNWLMAAEFTLARHSGTLDYIDILRSRRPYSYSADRRATKG